MAVTNEEVNGVDAVSFGKLMGKVEMILDKLDKMDGTFLTQAESAIIQKDIDRRLTALEKERKEKRSLVVAWVACIFAGLSAVGTSLALVIK